MLLGLGALGDDGDPQRVGQLVQSGEQLGIGHLPFALDERPIELVRKAKSESRETTFDYDLRGLEALEPVLVRLAEQLCQTLARQGRRGRTIGIKIRLDDFSTHTRARTRPAPTADVAVVSAVALELLREFDPPRPVRLLGVRVAALQGDPSGATLGGDEAEEESGRPPRDATAGQLELAM